MPLWEQPSDHLSAEQRELFEYQTRIRVRVEDIRDNKDGNE